MIKFSFLCLHSFLYPTFRQFSAVSEKQKWFRINHLENSFVYITVVITGLHNLVPQRPIVCVCTLTFLTAKVVPREIITNN